MGRKLNEFRLLMWKNIKEELRHCGFTLAELLLPVLLISTIVIVRGITRPNLKPFRMSEPLCVIPTICDEPPIPPAGAPVKQPISLLYTPSKNQIVSAAMETFKANFREVLPFESTSAMEKYYKSHLNEVHFGLEFPSLVGTASVPQDLKVTLRFPSEFMWLTNMVHKNRNGIFARHNVLYRDTGFTMVQASITLSLINAIKDGTMPSTTVPILKTANFTSPDSFQDKIIMNQKTMAPLVMQLSFIFNCICIVKKIATEKETRLKEAMKIMGMTNSINYITWYLKSFVILGLVMLMVTLIITVPWCPFFTSDKPPTYPGNYATLFWRSDKIMIAVFLSLYACAVISFAFMASSFFNKSSVATIGVALGWFLTITPYQLTIKENYGPALLYFCSLAMNSAMGYGLSVIFRFEADGMGARWDNIDTTVGPEPDVKISIIMVLLLFDAILYMLIAVYVDTAFPGEFGVPLPWYFPFTRAYWSSMIPQNEDNPKLNQCCWRKREIPPDDVVVDHEGTTKHLIEDDPTDLPLGVEIKHLRKVYGKHAAVKDLCLNMYENQILVMLGHNGAGKTTTVSMLIGMYTPTSGTAVIDGHDITTDIQGARNSLGYCPQHDVLFGFLTVEEHLYFFGNIKGLKGQPLKDEVDLYVKTLEIEDKRNTRADVLSAGLRRKLCVGIAFSAGSKLVILDEPTSGMDPSSRRALWDIIQKQKFGRVIILITHFMDEADLLGDRIAVMAEGELKACGSPYFLKNKMAIGYCLSVTKGPNCDPEEVTNLLKKYIENLKPDNNIAGQLTYVLPIEKNEVFADMLVDLETNSDELGVRGYVVSLPTMDSVFHELGAYKSGKLIKNLVQLKDISEIECYTGHLLLLNQILAMSMKRGLIFLRSWLWFLIVIILLMLNLTNVQLKIPKIDKIHDFPERIFTIKDYESKGAKVFIEVSTNNPLLDVYKQILDDDSLDYEIVHNLKEALTNKTTDYPEKFSRKYVVAVSFSEGPKGEQIVTSWYNNGSFHSEGVSLGQTLKALYKLLVGKNIEFSNKPFQFKQPIISKFEGNSATLAAQSITVGMCFVSAFYTMFYVKERISNSKHIQLISGVRIFIFWLVSFLFDFATFIGVITVCIILLVIFKLDSMKTPEELRCVLNVLVLFGFANLPLIYLCSLMFKSSSLAFGVFAIVGYMFSDVNYGVNQAFKTSNLTRKAGETLESIYMVVPQYSLAVAIGNIYSKNYFNEICQSEVSYCRLYTDHVDGENICWEKACQTQKKYNIDCCGDRVPYIYTNDKTGVWISMKYFLITGCLLQLVIIVIDYKLIQWLSNYTKTRHDTFPFDESDSFDPIKLVHRAESEASRKTIYVMKLKNASKKYGKLEAVNDVSMETRRSECFGILGGSGAGKTSIFKMVTGEVVMNKGNAWIGGYSIRTEHRHVYQMIGYCPQFDALLEELTVKETLTIFSLLKGVPLRHCKAVTTQAAENLNYLHHFNKVVKKLSGGTKRKLSTSLAMTGSPLIIFLDEPTSGMDPASQRYSWNIFCQLRSRGTSILMTSHSMEECEAMFDRYVVLSHGQILCVGEQQELVDKHCHQEYTVIIKVKKDRDDSVNAERTRKVDEFINSNFSNSILKERYRALLKYSVPKDMPCSSIFMELESSKSDLEIEDYSIGLPSLEHVFLAVNGYK